MKQIALLEYTFMFDPVTTWQRGSQFEKDLSDFFAAHGYEANILETTGNSNRRILYIEKIEIMPTLINSPAQVGRPPQINTLLNRMAPYTPRAAERDFKKGKFLKSKGYIKRPSVT